MTRSTWFMLLLGAPAIALLLFGPRGAVHIPQGRVVVRYWEKWTGVEAEAMQRVVDEFNETIGHDEGIWIEYSSISDIDKRTMIAAAAGDPPDISGLDDRMVAQFADLDALLEIGDLVREFGIDGDKFKPTWWNIGEYKGGLYALPSTPFTIALYYNRAAYRAAGLDPDRPPRTTAELNDYAVKLTKKDERGRITQLGFTTSPLMLGWWHWAWPFFFDGQLWDGDRLRIDTPESRASFLWTQERRSRMGISAVESFESSSGAIEGAQNPFISGRLAMVFQGPWMSNWINHYNPDLDYAVAPFPSVTTERENVMASADVFVIPRAAPHPREAMRFLEFVMRQENLEEVCRAHCKVSPYRAPLERFEKDHPNPFIHVFDKMADSKYVFTCPRAPMFPEISQAMLVVLLDVLHADDPAKVDVAIEKGQRTIDLIVDAHQAKAARRAGR
ncbi:MAG: ABC transporter substrate-binding protein [Phycisphaerales bacterium]|nr:ABC transporter substrate-binding protein [Phycisphaerales bacterium]